MRFWGVERTGVSSGGVLRHRPARLETERLVLLPLGIEHAGALFEALRDPAIYRYVPGDAPLATDALEARYRRTSAGPAKPSERWWNWAVATRAAETRPFGTVEVSLTSSGAHAQLAYLFGVAAWGHGFAFEACGAAVAYVRDQARTERIDAYIDTRNERSIRLAERLGLRRVETIIGADHFKGSVSDEYHYRLLSTK
jgi:ribosomal-protein-alanine N-acetyltransferase